MSDLDKFVGYLYDPPSGRQYGFPKEYRPLPGESLEETLRRDGYPESLIAQGMSRYCRFIGKKEFETLVKLWEG